jgi:hypothetical protein
MLFFISGNHSIRTHKTMHNIPCLQIQPVDGPKAIVLLILSIKGVHWLSTTQIVCPSLTTIKYPAGNEEAGNATESALQVTDQHVNVANLATKGSELHNWMEPPGNDENQLLLQERISPNKTLILKCRTMTCNQEYSHPQSSMESAKIVTKLEVTRSVHVHGANMEQPIMQAERGPLREYNSA